MKEKDKDKKLDEFLSKLYLQVLAEEDFLLIQCACSRNSKVLHDNVEYNFSQLIQEREKLDIVDDVGCNLFMILLRSANQNNGYKLSEIEILLDRIMEIEDIASPSKAYLKHTNQNKESFLDYLEKIEEPKIRSEIIEKVLAAHINHRKYNIIESDEVFAEIFSKFGKDMNENLIMFFAITAKRTLFQDEARELLPEIRKEILDQKRRSYAKADKIDAEFAIALGIKIKQENINFLNNSVMNTLIANVPNNSTKKRPCENLVDDEVKTQKARTK